MMYLNELMNACHMSRAELSARSNIPESTLRAILNGKAQLDRCEAATLYNIAYALDVSVEDILEGYWDALERDAPARIAVHDDSSLMNFYVLADSMLGRLRATGDLAFIDGIDQNRTASIAARSTSHHSLVMLGLDCRQAATRGGNSSSVRPISRAPIAFSAPTEPP